MYVGIKWKNIETAVTRIAIQEIPLNPWDVCSVRLATHCWHTLRDVSGSLLTGTRRRFADKPTQRVVMWVICVHLRGGADKFVARPGRKQATAAKLGIYSTHSPRSSIHFLARCSNVCKPLKKIQKFVRPTRSPRQQWPPRRTKNGALLIFFFSPARVSMLLKSRASPDMLPFSLFNKKRLAIRNMNWPLFPTTLSIPSYDIGK